MMVVNWWLKWNAINRYCRWLFTLTINEASNDNNKNKCLILYCVKVVSRWGLTKKVLTIDEHVNDKMSQSISVEMARVRSTTTKHRLFRFFIVHIINETWMIWLIKTCGSEVGKKWKKRLKEALNGIRVTSAW